MSETEARRRYPDEEKDADPADFEDGEIKVIDDENYILSDSYFNF